jgi:hypothetical protein
MKEPPEAEKSLLYFPAKASSSTEMNKAHEHLNDRTVFHFAFHILLHPPLKYYSLIFQHEPVSLQPCHGGFG